MQIWIFFVIYKKIERERENEYVTFVCVNYYKLLLKDESNRISHSYAFTRRREGRKD
jgi:hypothetical protein